MRFGFDLLLAICFQAIGQTRRAVPDILVTQPQAFFPALVVFSGLGFMPLIAVYGPFQWLEWGPFVIGQACRPVLYAVYFVAGVAVVGRGHGVEQASELEPADHAAADPLGER
jgi:hypothetical protein